MGRSYIEYRFFHQEVKNRARAVSSLLNACFAILNIETT